MLALAAFLTAFYMFRVVFIAFFGAPAAGHAGEHGHGADHAHDAPAIMTIPLWILAALAMVIGVGFAVSHPRAEFEAPGWITPLAVTVAVAGILLAWLTYQRRAIDAEALARVFGAVRFAAIRRFWLDDLFTGIYGGLVLGISRVVGWIDRYLVDGIVNLFSAWTLWLGDKLRGIQSGLAQDYVYAVVLGVILLMVWNRWGR
jgi:NADH-quinone oxidoreductase subunit L